MLYRCAECKWANPDGTMCYKLWQKYGFKEAYKIMNNSSSTCDSFLEKDSPVIEAQRTSDLSLNSRKVGTTVKVGKVMKRSKSYVDYE